MAEHASSGGGVAVALLYERRDRGMHVRDALASLGTPIVYEAQAQAFDRAALDESQANVVVVNLDGDDDAGLDDVYALLDEPRLRVIFNDSDVSSELSGWDQARWARHLAAKILGGADIDPPRPADAEAIPVQERSPLAADAAEQSELASAPVDVMSSPTIAEVTEPEPVIDEMALESSVPEVQGTDEADLAAAADLNLASEWTLDDEVAETSGAKNQDAQTGAEAEGIDIGMLSDADLDALLDAVPKTFEESASKPAGEAVEVEPQASAADSLEDGFDPADIEALLSSFDSALPPETPEPPLAETFDPATLDVSLELEEEMLEASPAPAFADGGLSLDPIEDADAEEDAEPTAAAAAIPAPKPTAPAIDVPSWTLEDVVDIDDEPAAPPPKPAQGPAEFGIEKLSAEEFLAPSEEDTAPMSTEAESGLSLELIPLEEAVAPVAVERADRETETWFDPSVVKQKVRKVWVLGASIGGPESVREFLAEFPRGYPALFLLAQHLGQEFVDMMTRQLAKATPLTVRTPAHGDRVGHGEVVIVPITHRLLVDAEGVVVLERNEEELPYSPSIDRVLHDVADRFGANAGAIVFSGMSNDAIEGGTYLAGKGGKVYAQSPETCVVSAMVDGLSEAGVVGFVGSPKELAQKLLSEK